MGGRRGVARLIEGFISRSLPLLFSPFLSCVIIKNVTESEVKAERREAEKKERRSGALSRAGNVSSPSNQRCRFSSLRKTLRTCVATSPAVKASADAAACGAEGSAGSKKAATEAECERTVSTSDGSGCWFRFRILLEFFLKNENNFTKKKRRKLCSLCLSLSLSRARARSLPPRGPWAVVAPPPPFQTGPR